MNNPWPRAIYCIVVDTVIWVGTGYVVFGLGRSEWWFALAMAVSAAVGVPKGGSEK